MKTIIIIPARYASSRYPGKPLVELHDIHGVSKPLIQRSWDAAMAVAGVDAVYVATDDERIRTVSESFGAKVVMTSETCHNGTERCSDALAVLDVQADIIVNFQGDAPLTPSWFVESLIDELKTNADVQMATPVLRCDTKTYQNFVADRLNGQVGGTTVVFNHYNNALYFSKEVIPYTGKTYSDDQQVPVFHHVGVYAYRPTALKNYMSWQSGALEELEGLEQLRFLENGTKVRCVEVQALGRVFWELNNPIDIERIESVLGT